MLNDSIVDEAAVDATTPRRATQRSECTEAATLRGATPVETEVELATITDDPRTTMRESLNLETVTEYAAQMNAGAAFPPPEVWKVENGRLHVVSGHHRIAAAKKLGRTRMLVTLRIGTERDAIFAAASENATHGLPRTNGDKRVAVKTLLDDSEWSDWSDGAIAKHCGVHQTFVSKLRRELSTQVGIESPTVRRKKGGGKINTAKIGKRPRAKRNEAAISTPGDEEGEVQSTKAVEPATAEVGVTMPDICSADAPDERHASESAEPIAVLIDAASDPTALRSRLACSRDWLNDEVVKASDTGAKESTRVTIHLKLSELRELRALLDESMALFTSAKVAVL